jgi:tetratricopeptide (TPR) repeat protein
MKNINFKLITLLVIVTFCSCQFYNEKKEKFRAELIKANAFYEKGDYKSALSFYNSLIKKDSLNGEIYYKRGYCKSQLFNPKTSENDYKKAIRFNYRVKDAYFSLGVNETFYNDSLALKYFNIVLAMDSTYEKAKTLKKEAIERLKRRTTLKDNLKCI